MLKNGITKAFSSSLRRFCLRPVEWDSKRRPFLGQPRCPAALQGSQEVQKWQDRRIIPGKKIADEYANLGIIP